MPINFSGRHFPSAIIMQTLRYSLAYKLSYREIEEIFAERNIYFAHSTLNRWVIKYSPQLEANFRTRKRNVAEATLAGVELCSMLKQGQMIYSEDKTVWEQFYSLVA